jgi:hypothetical protein
MEEKQYMLRYHFQHSQPVQLSSFVKSLEALSEEFAVFTHERGDKLVSPGLYLEKVEEGSIICDLVVQLGAGVIPMIEGVNTLADFFQHLKTIWNHFLGRGELPPNVSTKSLQRASAVVTPAAEDPNSSLIASVMEVTNGSVNVYNNCNITINNQESNALQNSVNREVNIRKEQEVEERVYEGVLLQLSQLNKDKSADYGTIEKLHPKPVKLLFNEADKGILTVEAEDNPFQWLYWVDVKTMVAGGKLKAYEILKVRERFKDDNMT